MYIVSENPVNNPTGNVINLNNDNPDIAEIEHHVINHPRLRKLCIWDILYLLFGISRKVKYVVCKANIIRLPAVNRSWLR